MRWIVHMRGASDGTSLLLKLGTEEIDQDLVEVGGGHLTPHHVHHQSLLKEHGS
jgi:hypothetical protein